MSKAKFSTMLERTELSESRRDSLIEGVQPGDRDTDQGEWIDTSLDEEKVDYILRTSGLTDLQYKAWRRLLFIREPWAGMERAEINRVNQRVQDSKHKVLRRVVELGLDRGLAADEG